MMMVNIFFYIVSYDVWFYWTHRWLHSKYLYSRVHCFHHETEYKDMTYRDTNRGHIVETLLQGFGIFIPLFLFSFQSIHFW
jgi:sterol desaturase/sphingolipid hydroxylase (fatty acid hydroxylase superfamily)